MAANEYYNPSSRNQTPQPQAYTPYQGYDRPVPPGPAPSYHSQPPSRVGTVRTQDITSPVSPFEAPFDDHVYPAPQRPQQHGFDSQSTLGSDTRYYGGGAPLDEQNSYQDNIPLRDHPGLPMKDNNSTDHVYDATNAPAHLEDGRMNNRLSSAMGLDTLKNRKTRIPWVVYILTTIQVAVFIAEIVKNGKCKLWSS